MTGFTKLESPTRQQREAILKKYHAEIFAYPNWLKVLEALGLKKTEPAAVEAVENARHMQGGGEGESHKNLKMRTFNQPSLVDGPKKPKFRECEFPLPSGDRLDVYFEHGRMQWAVEVKPSTSGVKDIARGLFQCAKYEVILSKWRAWQSIQADIRVVLALGGQLPDSLLDLRNSLQVRVIDRLEER